MKLLITGAYDYSENQLNKLESLGYVVFHVQEERIPLSEQDIDFNVADIEVVVCNGLFLYNDISDFVKLKCIHLTSAGLDRVPLDYISHNNIELYNAGGVYSIPMAEWTVLKVLEVYKQSRHFYSNQKNKQWIKNRNIREINNKTVSIVGCGSVGEEVAKRFKAFGAEVIGIDIKTVTGVDRYYHPDQIETAIETSDIVILTLPLTKETKYMFDRRLFEKMKEDSIFINISRGSVIRESDLLEVLKEGKRITAVLDVFENEPLSEKSELWNYDNVIITPHNSFISDKTSERLFDLIYERLKEIFDGCNMKL